MAAKEATALAIEAGELAPGRANASLLARALAPFNAVWSKITVKPDADDADASSGDPTLARVADADIDVEPAAPGLLAKGISAIRPLLAKVVTRETADDVDVEPAEPTPSKTLRERTATMRALLPADLSVADIKRSIIATTTSLIARARALNLEDVIGAAGRVPAIALFAVIVVAALPLLLADLGATYARNWWADRADRNDDDDLDLDIDLDGPPADAEPLAQAA
jgi:hypothetical protein